MTGLQEKPQEDSMVYGTRTFPLNLARCLGFDCVRHIVSRESVFVTLLLEFSSSGALLSVGDYNIKLFTDI
jgi:hypothetical protein